jgi:5-methylcytosine-specific restriction endonuclease McrA
MPYMTALLQVLRRSSKTSTLKFALARALVEFVEERPNQRTFSATEVAERLLQYYWYQVGKFHLKQAPHKKQKTTVETIIGKLGTGYQKFTDVPAGRRAQETERMVERGFNEVRRRFHNLRRGGHVNVRFFNWNRRVLTIPDAARRFLSEQPMALKALISLHWALELEKWNHVPRITSKVLYDPRAARGRLCHRKELIAIARREGCFYCELPLNRRPPIDHVIPRSFVFEDEVWNLVAACKRCNGAKSDTLPHKRFIAKLAARNSRLLEQDNALKEPMRQSLLTLPRFNGAGDAEAMYRALAQLLKDAESQAFAGAWCPPIETCQQRGSR